VTLTYAASLFGNEATAAWLAEIDAVDVPVFLACREADDRLGGVWWIHSGRWLGALPSRRWILGTCDAEYPLAEVAMGEMAFCDGWEWLMGRAER
jgi:hypothetical protein